MFKWLDLLEKEFDRSFVQLDLLLGEVEEENKQVTNEGRDKLGIISSCFSQLCHKAQTLAQMNCKLEAEVVNLQTDYFTSSSKSKTENEENEKLVLQLHEAQLKNAKSEGLPVDELHAKISSELEEWKIDRQALNRARVSAALFEEENQKLHREILSLQDDLFGARLASKYLDKELAGRIQQIQLLGREIKNNDYERLWNQLEAEIHLHRHKTVIRACQATLGDGPASLNGAVPGAVGVVRRVVINKCEKEGLGLAIVGGKQLGTPILISEIYAGKAASQSRNVYVGDAILSVNGIDLRNLKHNDAVKILTDQDGQVELELLYISPEEGAAKLTRLESHDVSTSMGPSTYANLTAKGADELPEVPQDEPITDIPDKTEETSLALTNDPEVESLKSETVALDSLRSEIESHSEK